MSMSGNRLTVDLDKFIAIMVQCCILLILTATVLGDLATLEFLCFFSLVNTGVVLFSVCKISKQVYSVSSMFLLFLAVFHFGQAWLYVFGAKVDKTISYDIFSLYPHENIYNILYFSIVCYNLVALFWLVFYKKTKKTDVLTENQASDSGLLERETVFRFGIVLFLVLLVPVLVYDYLSVTLTAQFGHVGLYENSGMLAIWAAANSYFPLAIILVLLGCDPQKNGWRWMYCYAVGRCLLLMILTGKRGSFVIPLLLYVFCKHHFIKKYKRKQLIWILIAGILLLSLISFISYGRGDYSNLNFWDFIIEKNIVTQILSELGGSFTTTVLSYNYTLSNGFLEGKSYLGALSVLLPFSDWIAPELKQFYSLETILNPYSPSGGALGGSLFGEMYINFGFFSLLLSPLLAWAISKIENIIGQMQKHSLFAVCSSVYISYGFWIFVRGNFVDVIFIVKRTLYVFILFWLFKTVLVRRKIYEEKPLNRIQ